MEYLAPLGHAMQRGGGYVTAKCMPMEWAELTWNSTWQACCHFNEEWPTSVWSPLGMRPILMRDGRCRVSHDARSTTPHEKRAHGANLYDSKDRVSRSWKLAC